MLKVLMKSDNLTNCISLKFIGREGSKTKGLMKIDQATKTTSYTVKNLSRNATHKCTEYPRADYFFLLMFAFPISNFMLTFCMDENCSL